jgi:hypothetical protein
MSDYAQWEYRILSFGSAWKGAKDEEIEATLNEWGADGWEVIGFSTAPPQVKVAAKRPLTRAVRRQRTMTDDN